jgi:serine/threonine protein kinase
MSYCVAIGCQQPANLDNQRVCNHCGAKLLLKDRYRPIQPIGQGGFGRTFLAIDEHIPSKPWCVIKQLYLENPNPDVYEKARQLFQQEAVRLDDLGEYPQIPALLAHFEQNQELYLVQEFIEGQTLEQEAKQRRSFSEAEITALLQDVLPILQFIHDRNIIHRDIKPSNIIRRKADGRLVLIDFGIAKAISSNTLVKTGTVIGTIEYMPPEQVRGKVYPASDLYSLGVLCIHLLTGSQPFDLFDPTENAWVWRQALANGKRVSRRFGMVLDKLLQPAIKHRYKSATEVLHDLNTPVQSPVAAMVSAATTTNFYPSSRETLATDDAKPGAQVRLNYGKLQALLANGKWRQADEATWAAIRQLLNKQPSEIVFSGDLHRLPCGDLQAIDQIWIKYSRGRFGFSVQARIYKAADEDYGKFCDCVGWQRDNGTDRHRDRWQFDSAALTGHLPSRLGIGGQHWYRHIGIMASRLVGCVER